MNSRCNGGASFRDRIQLGESMMGTVLTFPDPALAELASAAFDFVWVDLEHGALSLRDLQAMAIGAQAAGRPSLARLPHWNTEHLAGILDSGIAGVVAPMIESAEQASMVRQRMRYPSNGSRGFGLRRAGSYGRESERWSTMDNNLVCAVQIETARGLEAIEDIVAVDGVDAVVIGCSDLSFALGTPLDFLSDPMITAVRRIQGAAMANGVASGVAISGQPEVVANVVGGLSTIVVYSADVRIYAGAMDDAASAISNALSLFPILARDNK